METMMNQLKGKLELLIDTLKKKLQLNLIDFNVIGQISGARKRKRLLLEMCLYGGGQVRANICMSLLLAGMSLVG